MVRDWMALGRKRSLKGSFTVEASFVIPVIIIGITALIWIVFYLSNSVKMMAEADNIVFILEADAASNRNEGSAEKEFAWDETSKFYGAKGIDGLAKRDGRNIEVRLNLTHNLPEEGMLGEIVSGIRKISVEKQEKVPDPSEISRLIKAAGEIIGQLKQAYGK